MTSFSSLPNLDWSAHTFHTASRSTDGAAEATTSAADDSVTKPADAPSGGAATEALTAASRAALMALDPLVVANSREGFERAVHWADKAVALAPALDARQKDAQAKVGLPGLSP